VLLINNKETWEWGEDIVKKGSYDGSDLFVAKHFERATACTKKMLEIVYKEKLTNFEFRPHGFPLGKTPPAIKLKEFFSKN